MRGDGPRWVAASSRGATCPAGLRSLASARWRPDATSCGVAAPIPTPREDPRASRHDSDREPRKGRSLPDGAQGSSAQGPVSGPGRMGVGTLCSRPSARSRRSQWGAARRSVRSREPVASGTDRDDVVTQSMWERPGWAPSDAQARRCAGGSARRGARPSCGDWVGRVRQTALPTPAPIAIDAPLVRGCVFFLTAVLRSWESRPHWEGGAVLCAVVRTVRRAPFLESALIDPLGRG
jgi:hypothetical protein